MLVGTGIYSIAFAIASPERWMTQDFLGPTALVDLGPSGLGQTLSLSVETLALWMWWGPSLCAFKMTLALWVWAGH